MGRSGFAAIIGVGLLLAACGSSKKGGNPSPSPEVTSCDAGRKRCDGQKILVCNAEGSAETTQQTCAADLFCRVDGDDAKCDTFACLANTPMCNGTVATTCKPDGSGPKPGGVDCADTEQNCNGGKCEDIVCRAGERLCRNGDVYQCDDKGRPNMLLVDCQGTNLCDADAGNCAPRICEPGQPSCDKSVAGTCNDFGTALLPGAVDCADSDEKCLAGKCGTQICVPVQKYCEDDSVYLCDGIGATSTLFKDCKQDDPNSHCEPSGGGYAYCAPDECEPGEKRCINNVLKTCSDNHSLSGAGEDCGSDSYCEDGACHAQDCVQGTAFCKDGDIYSCDHQAPPSLVSDCGDDQTCKDVAPAADPFSFSGATCVPVTCTPGSTACLLNKVGTCGSDGESLSAVTTDCTATDSVCTADNKCAAKVTDTIGTGDETNEVIAGTVFVGAVLEVRSTRMLTELQIWLSLSGQRDIRFVIYEQSGSSFIAKVDKLVSTPAGGGFVSSGPSSFSYTLQAGKLYALGITSTTDVIVATDTAPFNAGPSFGNVLGRLFDSYMPTLIAANAYSSLMVPYMKTVTELP